MNGRWISTSIGGGTLHDKEVDFYIEGGWIATGFLRISTCLGGEFHHAKEVDIYILWG